MCHGQLLSEAVRRARKVHRCNGCSREIRPGERYLATSGVSEDRELIATKDCATCAAISRVYQQEMAQGECYYPDRPREWFKEFAREGRGDLLRKWFIEARAALFGPAAPKN